jgi:single-strand DNA-binding protein
MANLNRVLLIGRLTRDPELRSFSNGGRVAKFGFAVNNRKKNQQTGQWEDEPVFLECEAFNRGPADGGGRKLADLVEQYLNKGRQVFLDGHLRLDQWTSNQDGQKRQKLVVVVDDLQFLDSKQDGQGGGGTRSAPAPMKQPVGAAVEYEGSGGDEVPEFSSEGPSNASDIPF